ncbi:M23 family metallopeptidase [Sphingobacterium siyangense]|nr:M23 family metallopeptidase [Sphingobacterium siyangense]
MKVASPFGIRIHPIKLKSIHHNGVDLAARGSPVFNILSGTVVKAGESPSLGKFLAIGSGEILITYAHLSRLLVQKDQYLQPGHLIGVSGRTGMATGEHLHLSVKIWGQFIDPILFIKKLNEFNLNLLNRQKNE